MVTGLPWSVVIVLGAVIALVAYPLMTGLWLYGLRNVVTEFTPRAALAIIISAAILGPIFAMAFPLAQAARVLVGPAEPSVGPRTRVRINAEAWRREWESPIIDQIDDMSEIARVPFLMSLDGQSCRRVSLGILTQADWGEVHRTGSDSKDFRVVRAAMNALVHRGDESVFHDLESAISESMSGDDRDAALKMLSIQRRQITRDEQPR